jgi:CRP-like cAMP-binding protein
MSDLLIPRPDFQALLERHPGLAFHIMQEMSQRLRSSWMARMPTCVT